MNDTKKMLRAIINGQSANKDELLKKIDNAEVKLSGRMDKLDTKMDKVEKNLTQRIDKLGLQLTRLEDDSPTQEEHDRLEGRVSKLEHKTASL